MKKSRDKISKKRSNENPQQVNVLPPIPLFEGFDGFKSSHLRGISKNTSGTKGMLRRFFYIFGEKRSLPPSKGIEMKKSLFEQTKFLVSEMAKDRNNNTYYTNSIIDSSVIIEQIFKHAKKEVKIYDFTLDDKIVGQNNSVFTELNKFISAGKSLTVVLQNPKAKLSHFFYTIAENALDNKNIQLKIANDDFNKNINSVMNENLYFIVSDNGAYKLNLYQRNLKHLNPKYENKAVYSFNDENISQKLNSIFDKTDLEKCPNFI